jgi:LacI family transcriptional regulator
MNHKRATIYEVARVAGVSTATVSRVLNDSPNVAKKTKENVLKVIDKMAFSPQLTAQKLAGGSPQTLGVVVPSFTTPYFNEVLKGIKDGLMGTDLDLMLYNTGSENKEERMQLFFNHGMADAVIIVSINLTEKAHQHLQSTGTPTVLINSSRPDYSYYELNDYEGSYLAGEHLAQQGFKEIGMISSPTDSQMAKDRRRGFMDALEANHIPINENYFVKGDTTKHGGLTEETGFEAVQKLSEAGKYPEAIFCTDDTQAIGAIYGLSQAGLNVPDDIAIMGYDNIKMSKFLDLTTIDQKMYSVGTGSIECLLEQFNRPKERSMRQIQIEPELVVRGSTKRKKKAM